MNQSRFLSAEWRKLILANYIVDPSLLLKWVPAKTELDIFNNNCYVSLVGFMFTNVKVAGLKIPFHVNFPEVNLRIYVRYKEKDEWRRGVVFISEIVPRPAVSLIANRLFNERYRTMKMSYNHDIAGDHQKIEYSWKFNNNWNIIACESEQSGFRIAEKSEEDFITQHFWGYTALNNNRVAEYHVEHPLWKVYPVKDYKIHCDFEDLYGKDFQFLANENPTSVIFAEGSPITVYSKRII